MSKIYLVKTRHDYKTGIEIYSSLTIKYAVYRPKLTSGYRILMKNKNFPNEFNVAPSHYKTFDNKLKMYKFMINSDSYLDSKLKKELISKHPECCI